MTLEQSSPDQLHTLLGVRSHGGAYTLPRDILHFDPKYPHVLYLEFLSCERRRATHTLRGPHTSGASPSRLQGEVSGCISRCWWPPLRWLSLPRRYVEVAPGSFLGGLPGKDTLLNVIFEVFADFTPLCLHMASVHIPYLWLLATCPHIWPT